MVVEFSGAGTENGYRLLNADGTWWENTAHSIMQWSMKYSENVVVYVPVRTSGGFRYLYYTTASQDNLGDGTYVHHGLSDMAKDGAWHTFTRDLEHDLQEAQPGNTLEAVLGFYIRGSGRVGSVTTHASFPEGIDADADGLTDLEEITVYGTSPYLIDTDGDGMDDAAEYAYWGSQWNADVDGDGIINLLDADSDNDGINDGLEVASGADPGDVASIVERMVYEDGENGDIAGWDVYDNDPEGASISNIQNPDGNGRVIQLSGTGTANGFRFRNPDGSWLNNGGHRILEWHMNFSENVIVYVAVQTAQGFRYLTYTTADHDSLGEGNYIYHGLSSLASDGAWHTFARDLEHDLQEAQPGNTLEAILGVLVRGSGLIDDIATANELPVELDNDGDGLTDKDEMTLYGSSPYLVDTDGDSLEDAVELTLWGERWNHDPDGDGVVNLLDFDADNDGIHDGLEVRLGTDPADAADVPGNVMYEDCEDGDAAGWDIYDLDPAGAFFSNVQDAERGGRVMELSGSGTANGFRLRSPDGGPWANSAHVTIQWSMKYAEPFVIYIPVLTSNGFRYLYYTGAEHDNLGDSTYIHHGLGSGAHDGAWRTFTRNLEDDLKEAQPANELESIDGFLIRGSGRIDDIGTQ
jgi:hypothetical protein